MRPATIRARAEGDGPPEIRNLNAKINSLADTLDGLNRANDELMERVFDAHDEERQLIAHELHDEFGPHLFALRASAAVLAKTIGDQPAARAAASAIEAQVGELQGQNRRILADLRPAALEELGLVEALEALVAHWRRADPKMAVTLEVDPRVEALGERASLMAYRFVQEAMTNAFRHAGATRIEASLTFETPVEAPSLRDPALAGLVIRVADDGRGLNGEAEAGHGPRRHARPGPAAWAGGRHRVAAGRRGRGRGALCNGRSRSASGKNSRHLREASPAKIPIIEMTCGAAARIF